jgi:hypothetical protein
MRAGDPPLLKVDGLRKRYTRGLLSPQVTFSLQADFAVQGPEVIGVMGPNGSGKTTLFELITGSNQSSSGSVHVAGRDIHRVKTRERDRLAIHYHQSYQVRAYRHTRPDWLLQPARSERYIGFMLDFFHRLRAEGRLVFLCLHPNEPFHLDILRETCERFLFVQQGSVSELPDFGTLIADARVRRYLGRLADHGGTDAAAEATDIAAAGGPKDR